MITWEILFKTWAILFNKWVLFNKWGDVLN